MHLWSHPHTASNALRIEAAGQRDTQTTELVYLGGAISESAEHDSHRRRLGECRKIQFPIVRPTERPAVAQGQAV